MIEELHILALGLSLIELYKHNFGLWFINEMPLKNINERFDNLPSSNDIKLRSTVQSLFV